MAAAPERLIYSIEVNSKGASQELKDFDKSVQQLNKSTQNVSKTFDLFKGVLAGYLSFQGAKAFLELADAMQETQVRLTILTGSMEAAVAVQSELFDIAQKHSIALKDLSKAYIQIAPVLQEQGKSQKEILTFTDDLIASYKLIGQSSSEAAQSVSALAQAYAAGKIDAQQLNKVLTDNRQILKAVADQMGVSERELLKMAKAGKVSGEQFFQAIIKAGKEWQEEAKKLPTGIDEAMTNLSNSLTKLAGDFAPVVQAISSFILLFSENFTAAMAAAAAGIGVVTVALGAAKIATINWTAALTANPIGLIAVAIAGATFLIIKNWKEVELFFYTLWNVNIPNWIDMGIIAWLEFGQMIELGLKEIGDLFAGWANKIIGIYNDIAEKLDWEKITEVKFKFDDTATDNQIEEINKKISERNDALAVYLSTLNQVDKKTKDILNQKPTTPEVPPAKTFGPGLTEEDWAWLDEEEIGSVGEAMLKAAEDSETLNDALKALGTNDPLGGFSIGIQKAMNEIPTLTESFSKIGEEVFGQLTDSMMNFIDTGKFAFGEFFKDLGKSIAKIGIQKLAIYAVDLAMKAIGITPVAKGGVFENGKLTPFARGGIVTKPTLFPMANGAGLMGEAGPEGILPLQRNQQGKLGVTAAGMGGNTTIVNVYNQTKDSEVETKESTDANGMKKIDVYISQKIRGAFQSGEMDRTMQTSFGLSRVGSR